MSSNAAPLPQAKPGNEPSMEEILASIRRIIADDTVGTKRDEAYVPPPPPPPAAAQPAPAPAPAPPPQQDENPDADVLDLADVAIVSNDVDDLMVGESEEEQDEDLIGTPVDVDPTPVAAPALVAPLVAPSAPLNTVTQMNDHILSRETGGLVANAFAQLQRTTQMPANGRTLEDLVVEMLRPMLTDWMDQHLPSIVERLVKAEIERVSRG
jgi:cell pole-organizing protein PopZ